MELNLEQSEYLLISIGLAIGAVVGSFLNVIIVRLPPQLSFQWTRQCHDFLAINQNEKSPEPPPSIMHPWSHCLSCKRMLSFWQNIPVFSFFILKGRCYFCSVPISIQYPVIETITALTTVVAVLRYGVNLTTFCALLFSYSLIVLAAIDFKEKLLPDKITLPLLWAGLAINTKNRFVPLEEAVIGAILGYLTFWSIYWLFKLITNKDGMGYGDFKFLAALGAWVGWKMLPLIVLMASSVGLVVGIIGIILKRINQQEPIAFGPFIAMAGYIVFYFGENIAGCYLRLISI